MIDIMRIAIPADADTMSAKIAADPATAKFYIIADLEGGKVKHHEALANTMPAGVKDPIGGIAFMLSGKKVEAAVVGSIEEAQRATLVGVGLKVFPLAKGTVSDAIRQFNEGVLDEASDLGRCACDSEGCP